MKSSRIIFILFFSLNLLIQIPAVSLTIPDKSTMNQVDSLVSARTFENANATINYHKEELLKGTEATNDVLKQVALSYAIMNNEVKASEYVVQYIQNSHDLSILNNSAFDKFEKTALFQSVVKKYKPHLNGWLLFFFATGLIGIFISVVLNLRKKGDTVGNILISLFVLFHSLFIIHLCLFLSNYNFNFPHSLYITTSFSFFYGPLLYFYFKRISKEYKFKKRDLLHLAPSVLLFLYFLPIYILPAQEKLHLLLNRDAVLHSTLITVVLLKYVSLIIYGFLIIKIYLTNKQKKQRPDDRIILWQKNIMVLNSIYVVSYIVYGAALMQFVRVSGLIYPQIFVMSTIILYVGYVAYVDPRVFSKKHIFRKFKLFKYKNSGLTKGLSNELKIALIRLLEDEKVYRSSNISLAYLSEALGTTRHNLSQVINEHFGMNFFHLINKFRIKEVLHIFNNEYKEGLHIIGVAYDVGFNNKVTFNKAFKLETNLTPTQYLNKEVRSNFATTA